MKERILKLIEIYKGQIHDMYVVVKTLEAVVKDLEEILKESENAPQS